MPSRIAAGLAYLPEFQGRKDVVGFHMWTQFYLEGHWVDFDAALGESECSPTRVALYTGSLNHDNMADIALSLMKVIGQIEIEVTEVEK